MVVFQVLFEEVAISTNKYSFGLPGEQRQRSQACRDDITPRTRAPCHSVWPRKPCIALEGDDSCPARGSTRCGVPWVGAIEKRLQRTFKKRSNRYFNRLRDLHSFFPLLRTGPLHGFAFRTLRLRNGQKQMVQLERATFECANVTGANI